LPPFFAAERNFEAGIFCPAFTPKERRNEPGFFIADCIHFLANYIIAFHTISN